MRRQGKLAWSPSCSTISSPRISSLLLKKCTGASHPQGLANSFSSRVDQNLILIPVTLWYNSEIIYRTTIKSPVWGRNPRAEFDVDGGKITLNIQVLSLFTEGNIFNFYSSSSLQDTGGSYVDDFPAMVELSLQSADAVLLGKFSPKLKSAKRSRSFLESSGCSM